MSDVNKENCVEEVAEITKLKLTPAQKLSREMDMFINDMECIKEMFNLVIPILEKKDSERKQIVEDFLTAKNKTMEEGKHNNISQIIKIEEIEQLSKNIKKLFRADTLFRQNAIVSLVSRYDDFLSGILNIVFREKPEKIKSSDKQISYKDLFGRESLESLLDEIIDKEVELIMRGSHYEQIEILDELLKLGIKEKFTNWDCFLEITERRNLFVHNGGKVNDLYLTNCRTLNVKLPKDINDNIPLSVSREYFDDAFKCFFELSFRIGQASFRRLFPYAIKEADSDLNKLGIDLIEAEEWDLAQKVFEFGINIPRKLISPGEYYNFFVINLCIALKWGGKEFLPTLESQNWEDKHPKYKLASHVLRENFEEAGKLMKSASIVEEVAELGFKEWPLFRDFRKTDIFKNNFCELFGKDFDKEYRDKVEKEVETAQSDIQANR